MRKVSLGIISTATIGTQKVIPGMLKSPSLDVKGIASRSLASARSAADQLGIEKAYGSYEELLADPEIEAVYNPLPNHLHVPWTLKASAAGKHVLCEKPIGMTAEDAAQLKSIDSDIVVMEAFMVRYHPQWIRARQLVSEGRIGTPRAVQVFFSYYNDDPSNIRNDASIGGGAAMDIGCYAIVAGRIAFGCDPLRIAAAIDRDPIFKTDRTTSGVADFGEGRQLTFTVSTQSTPYQRVQIVGTKGRIEIQIPFNAPQGEECQIFIDDGSDLRGAGLQQETLAACDQYQLQGEVFAKAIRGEIDMSGSIDDALINMRTLDAIFRSAETGRWEDV